MIQVTPVIFCGGSGTRLWSLSRTGFPKQFLCLTGNESLFKQAAQRLVSLGTECIQVAVFKAANRLSVPLRLYSKPWLWARPGDRAVVCTCGPALEWRFSPQPGLEPGPTDKQKAKLVKNTYKSTTYTCFR